MNFIKYICLIFIINLSLNINCMLYSAEDDNNSSTNTPNNNVSVSQADVSQEAPIESSSDLNENEVLADVNSMNNTEQVDNPNQVSEIITPTQTPQELAKIREANKAKDKNEVDSFLKSYEFLSDLNLDTEDTFVLPGDAEKYIIFQTPYKLIIVELYLSEAPKTTAFIKKLVREKFYDNTTFFRLIPNYIIQGGDPSDSSYGGYGTPRPAEINPELKFQRGTIAMSNVGNLQSDDSQYFITFNSFPWLDGQYSIFGKVISGITYLEKLTGKYDNDGFLDAPLLVVKAYVYSDYLAMKAEAKAKEKADADEQANAKIRQIQEDLKTKQKEASVKAKETDAARIIEDKNKKIEQSANSTGAKTDNTSNPTNANTSIPSDGKNTTATANSPNNKVTVPNNTSTTNTTSPQTPTNNTSKPTTSSPNTATNTEPTTNNRPSKTNSYGPR